MLQTEQSASGCSEAHTHFAFPAVVAGARRFRRHLDNTSLGCWAMVGGDVGSGDTRRIALGAPMAAWRTVRRRMAGVLDASVRCNVGALLELPAEGWGEVWEVHSVQNRRDEEQWRKTKMGVPLSREWTESRPKPTDMVRGPGQVVPPPGPYDQIQPPRRVWNQIPRVRQIPPLRHLQAPANQCTPSRCPLLLGLLAPGLLFCIPCCVLHHRATPPQLAKDQHLGLPHSESACWNRYAS